MELARHGGPDAVVLREAARQIGVSATAAYRYFVSRSILMKRVRELARAELAEYMVRAAAESHLPADKEAAALVTLRALGRGYIGFALDEPGLFRTAFQTDPADSETPPELAGSEAFLMLGRALDDLVAVGRIPPARRPMLELAVWAAVHGMAQLMLDGPLSRLPAEHQEPMIAATLGLVEHGLQPPPTSGR